MAEFQHELHILGKQLGDIAAKFNSLQAHAKADQQRVHDAKSAESRNAQSAVRLEAVLERGISLVTDASENEGPVGPQLYPGGGHAPAPRLDQLEHDKWDQTQVLDALKLDSFEGFYNLAMQVLVLAMVSALIPVLQLRQGSPVSG